MSRSPTSSRTDRDRSRYTNQDRQTYSNDTSGWARTDPTRDGTLNIKGTDSHRDGSEKIRKKFLTMKRIETEGTSQAPSSPHHRKRRRHCRWSQKQKRRHQLLLQERRKSHAR